MRVGAKAHPPVPPTDKDMPRERKKEEDMALKFKNDKERIAFLEDYRNEDHGWYLWKDDDDLQRKWWRFDLDDCALIVEERLQTLQWPNEHLSWLVSSWYIITDWHKPFADGSASRTQALAKLKEVTRK